MYQVPTMYSPCTHHVLAMYPPCTHPVRTTYSPCTDFDSQARSERSSAIEAKVDEAARGRRVAAQAAATRQAVARVDAWRSKQLPTRLPVAAPRVPSDVTKQYALLRKDPEGWSA